MAILGACTGTIGPITGYTRNCRNTLRSRTVRMKNSRTPLQQLQRQNIKLCNAFTKAFTDDNKDGIAAADDPVMLVAYAPDLQQAAFTLHAGFRKDKKATLNVTALKGYAVETWNGFLSKNEKDASNSVCAGRVSL